MYVHVTSYSRAVWQSFRGQARYGITLRNEKQLIKSGWGADVLLVNVTQTNLKQIYIRG
jgi:hypothetical protein